MLRQPDPRLAAPVTFGAVGGAHFGDGQAILPETLHHTGEPGQVLVAEALAHPATQLPDVYALAKLRSVPAQLDDHPSPRVEVSRPSAAYGPLVTTCYREAGHTVTGSYWDRTVLDPRGEYTLRNEAVSNELPTELDPIHGNGATR